jgi:flagellar motor switch protein FliG
MIYDRTDRIRRAAILVASLDDALAEQILAGLPPVERDRVLDEAEQLESIDADEQADVLAEFRRMTRGARRDAATVEFEYSRRDDEGAGRAEETTSSLPTTTSAQTPAAGLSDADATAMAELLSHEHPQIVAAALSRLGDEPSAAVFAQLPQSMQAEALQRLASLAPADEDAVQEVETQLQHRLQQRREHVARTAAGAELVRKILARTPAAQRTVLLERLAVKDATPAAASAVELRHTALPVADRPEGADSLAYQAQYLATAVRRAQATGGYTATPLEDRSEELELLSDEALVAALRMAGEVTVLRALAASGEMFLKRVTSMLPRRQARKLRGMLRDLGPTRLADLHAAQHELLRLAHECAAVEAAA